MLGANGRAPRILIIKPSSLGDIVHALPVLAALRRAHPAARIEWLVGSTFAPLLAGHPLLDEAIPFDRRHYGHLWRSPRALRDFLAFVLQLRRRRYDLVIDLQGLFRSGFLAWTTGAPQRVGFAAAREFTWLFYTQRVCCPQSARHAVDQNRCVAAALGLPADEPQFPLGLRPEDYAGARRLLDEASANCPPATFTALIPGARWETKRWRPERLAALIDRMHADGLPPCVLLGASADRPFADRILARCKADVVDLVGRTSLRQLAALIALSELVVCHDSGPMHIAAALKKPIVAIFGPTDPARTGPYCDTARIVATRVDCSPCRLRTCNHHSCMEGLDVETVVAAVRETYGATHEGHAAVLA